MMTLKTRPLTNLKNQDSETDKSLLTFPKSVVNMKLFLKLLIIILPFFATPGIHGQAAVKQRSVQSTGGSSKIVFSDGKIYYLQQTIGQPGITGVSQNNNYQLRQGFIQPPAGSVNIISSGNLKAVIFPNPFSDNIIISFSETISDNLHVALYDINGKIISVENYGALPDLFLNAGHLAPGIYFLRVSTATKFLYTKIIKL